ncbi:MAG TPA: thiamine biosynthesis protein ThiS [Flavobacteriales bacterium]|jgi:sulfur carrier protein|nr:thiamine biosynthesis protein ThiS [Crocinitomicaceae bacterium]HAE30935.1 thiamine biosynthesis protein ThiS [Flavobacteriales bacterium]|tara:strand:- start:761 stop:961 length:201 start_codon:yes stop_codon:yes gene_type:complete
MKIYLNGKENQINHSSLEALLVERGLLKKNGIALAVNNQVIPRANWTKVVLENNDKILIITATQGG